MSASYLAAQRAEICEGQAYATSPSFDYIPALDGLRAVSIALVVASHFGFHDYVPGLLGVTIFFFVSGLLITRQLLAELSEKGTISLPGFYMRRLLRLYPALLAMIVISSALFVSVGGSMTASDILSAMFYWMNYYAIAGHLSSGLPRAAHPFSVLWSLAVEEHYYLFFPCLVLLFGRDRMRFAGLIAAGIVAVTLWRLHLASACHDLAASCRWQDGGYDYLTHASDTRIDSILYGALLATLLGSQAAQGTLRLLNSRGAFAVACAALIGSLVIRDVWFRETFRFTLQGVGLLLCVGALLFADRLLLLRRMLSHQGFVLVGRWSYSLYLWHCVVLAMAGALLPEALWRPVYLHARPSLLWLATVFPALLLASLAAALASYYGVERPMLALRRRFGSRAVSDAVAVNERDSVPLTHGAVAVRRPG